jgi:two-component system, NarL family, sensor kinase
MPTRAPAGKQGHEGVTALRARLAEAEDTLDAIRSGAVDALVVRTPRGERLFTLKGADQTYRALVEAMNEGAVTLRNGVISYCNHHFAKMAGTPLEKVLGASIFDFVPSENLRRLSTRLQKGGQRRGSVEAVLHAANGARVPVVLSGSRFHSNGKASVGLVVTDIAERKEAELVRQELSRNILRAQESERKRVARDLHDGVNQLLASAKYRLYTVTRGLDGAVAPGMGEVVKLLDRAINEVRLISRNLRPSELDELGLEVALRALALEFQKRSGTAVRFKNWRQFERLRLPKDVEMTLYRIVQESLNNVERHSEASRVELAVSAATDGLILTVRDDGLGFGPAEKRGSGLQNMAERAAMLPGRLEVSSAPGKGTKITVRVLLGRAIRRMR